MNKFQKLCMQSVSPWENSFGDTDNLVFHGESRSRKRQNVSFGPSALASRSSPKIRISRTSIKMATISIEKQQHLSARPVRDRAESPTPRHSRKRRNRSLSSRKTEEILSIEAWRQQSKRLLGQEMRKGLLYNENKSKKQLQRQRDCSKDQNIMQMQEASLIYRKATADQPNRNRFKIIQWQRNTRF